MHLGKSLRLKTDRWQNLLLNSQTVTMTFITRAVYHLEPSFFPLSSPFLSFCAWPFSFALIIHRCCDCGEGVFVQGIPGVTQIDGDL